MHATAGRIVYETLRNHGVDCIFGMEDPVHIFHAVDRDATRIITFHDERHGAIMAHGYALASGRPGVCAATFGPGASNLITGLYEAQRSSVAVIALVQDHPLELRGRHANSELDHTAAFAPFVKATLRIDYPSQAGDVVRRAFRLACSGRPGPVVLLCPTDVVCEEAEAETHGDPRYAHFPALRPVAEPEAVTSAARLLAAANDPVLISGGGAMLSGAFGEVAALAERFNMPVATTLMGRGIIPDDHPLATGAVGDQTGARLGRGRIANEVVANADLVMILGSKTGQIAYSSWKLFAPGARIIHLDIDAGEIGRNFETEVALVGDVRETLRALLAQCEVEGIGASERDNGGRIATLKEAWRADNDPFVTSDDTPIRPERLIAEIDKIVDDRTLVVADASYSSGWVFSHIDIRAARRAILSPRGTGMIGWGLAAAVGARMGTPEDTVICVTGDGGFYYVMSELETLARYGLKVVTVVLNNSTLAFQRHYEEKAFGDYRECDFLDVDFAAAARALRCSAERVTEPGQIGAALTRGLAHDGPYLVDVVVSAEVSAPVIGIEREIDLRSGH